MYIHLGKNVIIKVKDIVGIFDIDKCSISKNTKQFLKYSQKYTQVINVCYELPKSFIVCNDKNNKQILYISQISTTTLKKRIMFNKK